MAKLSEKQKLFVECYLKHLNATQAAIEAGYSQKTAGSIGQENLTKPEIQKLIQESMDKRAKKVQVTAEEVLSELKKMAFIDLAGFYTEDVNGNRVIKKLEDLTDAQKASLLEIREDEIIIAGQKLGTNIKIKLHDKLKALELIGRHLKMFTDRVETSGSQDINVKERVWVAEWGGSFEQSDGKSDKDET